MRKLYEYISVEQKKEVVKQLKQSLEQLNDELSKNEKVLSPFVNELLLDAKDKWTLEIEELELEMKNHDKKHP
ncbi:MAG: hypothetical protein C6P37_05010 [Caldibacillus debilis]|uniref:Uncharacterized protein n=1 Tax=Caldibacillus debilis TaxID=301148 RepID=A0A3E0K5I4_9BACI|nr:MULTISPECIES: hypothetical protein [Bacillaceae]OUM84358.1 MAG: hypothetical protein BAA00_11515 [Parageobacillus thermoglucosidasius]REJ11481.1 MAG: hypothetical protein C6W58_18175 [Bacillaceae bacterium]REJ15785.1 MAG: hypothetical protein C6W57_09980 [Caldibacillus debilis]REJ29319.1 MAG: hypothetical protein C6P37_05010 [Caldibacillus debilis]